MANGYKTGGRTKGAPNRRTNDVADKLAALGCDPIAGMAAIAADPSASLELRGRMCNELAQYVYPKRKALAVEAVVQHWLARFGWGMKTQKSINKWMRH